MSAGESSLPQHVQLDELIALTDEMAALVRAGVPLEAGLADVAVEMARRPGKLASELAARMKSGETLEHVLSSSPETFPPAYCAVVTAGVRSGRLSTALEGLASVSRRASELRRMTRVALVYPAFIAFFAYGLFIGCLLWFQPQITSTYQIMKVAPTQWNLTLVRMGRLAIVWAPWIPLIVFAMLAIWWYRSKRATVAVSGWLAFTPAGKMLRASQMANFTELLALLIENETPLGEAVVLSAEASGDPRLIASARDFATVTQRGSKSQGLATSPQRHTIFPPLVQWLLSGGPQNSLAVSLRSTAAAYRRQAARLEHWLALYLPLALTIAIGGSAVLVYALCMLGPWYQMLIQLAGAHR